jgi:hypothetical protein
MIVSTLRSSIEYVASVKHATCLLLGLCLCRGILVRSNEMQLCELKHIGC